MQSPVGPSQFPVSITPTYLHVLPAEKFVPSMPMNTVCGEISGDRTPKLEGHLLASMCEQHQDRVSESAESSMRDPQLCDLFSTGF